MISSGFVESSETLLLVVAVKATVLFGIASVFALLLRRASAAARYLVWATALVGALLLSLLNTLLPAWEAPRSLAFASLPSALDSRSAPVPSAASRSSVDVGGGERTWPRDAVTPSSTGSAMIAHATPELASHAQDARSRWAGWLLAIWATGATILLLRIGAGWGEVHHLRRKARPVRDPAWSSSLRSASDAVGFEGDVTLLQSPSADVPMTWGILRPVVLLPAYSDSWPAAQRRAVLLHEMAHVARRDCLVQTLAEVACALYWFHPLAWQAARRLRVEREQACDDRVLSTGESAVAYADQLLAVARLCRSHRFSGLVAAAMARPSQLESRLVAVLDGSRNRGVPGWGARSLGLAGAVALLLMLGVNVAASRPAANAAEESAPLVTTIRSPAGERREGSLLPAPAQPETRPLAEASADSPAPSEQAVRSDSTTTQAGASEPPPPPTTATPALPAATGVAATSPDTGGVSAVAAYPGETIRIDLPAGGELRIVGWNRESVEVHTTVRGNAVTPETSLSRSEGGVRLVSTVGSGESGSGSRHYEIRVPSSAQLKIDSRSGGITVEGVRGAVSGQTGSGEIRLAHLNGELGLATGRGDVVISDSDVTGEARTQVGDLRLRNVKGALHVISAAGRGIFYNASVRMTALTPPQ